jgi:hypothetical protein
MKPSMYATVVMCASSLSNAIRDFRDAMALPPQRSNRDGRAIGENVDERIDESVQASNCEQIYRPLSLLIGQSCN